LPSFLETLLGNGYLAVGLFFLLSGFILAYTYYSQISGASNRARFWRARFARIYPVYVLSLVLAYPLERGLNLGTRVAVLTMVQAWNPFHPETAGAWNYPAWSLSVEAFFYIFFPFLMLVLANRSVRFLQWTAIVLLAASVLFHTPVMGLGDWNHSSVLGTFVPLPLLRIPEFLLGVALGIIFLRDSRSDPRPFRTYAALIVLVACLGLPLGPWVSLVMTPYTVLIYELAKGNTLISRLLCSRTMVLLGGASYSVYLLQFPVRSWVRAAFSHAPGALSGLGSPLTPLILVLFSIVVFEFWEEPSRRKLKQWFHAQRTKDTTASPQR
jgi:peptidoglycan/LPS O-acetylase OafA/YrhL